MGNTTRKYTQNGSGSYILGKGDNHEQLERLKKVPYKR